MANPFITGGTTYDLTNPAVNPKAKPKAHPINGVAVLTNEIDWTALALLTSSAKKVNLFKILEIPKNCHIRDLRFMAKPGATAPTHAYVGASLTSSAGKSATMNVGLLWYKSASLASTIADTDAFADHAITKKTGAVASCPTIVASTPWTQSIKQSDTSAPLEPITLPYGGFVTMGIPASVGASASTVTSSKFSGTLVVQALAFQYAP